MFAGYRIVACVPAGRQRTLSILLDHLRINRPILDGVQLWENVQPFDDRTVTSQTDLDYIHDQADDFVTVVPLDNKDKPRRPKQKNTGRFYRNTTDPDTIYIRFDDDIIYIHPDAIRRLLEARLEYPEPLVVFPLIWNNAIVSHFAQQQGLIEGWPPISRWCMDKVAWKDPNFGTYVHGLLLDRHPDRLEELYQPDQELSEQPFRNPPTVKPTRMSVSAICWLGSTMAGHAEEIWREEEEGWITATYPQRTNIWNRMAGRALVAHYSFHTQRPALDKTDILDRYRRIAQEMSHDSYTTLMDVYNPYQHTPWWQQQEVAV